MNDNISHEKAPRMTDAQLDRLLDELAPPAAPSDLLRARLRADSLRGLPRGAAPQGRTAPATAAPRAGRFSPRRALYGRIAAAFCLAALTGMAAWLPGPGPARDGRVARLVVPAVALPGLPVYDTAASRSGTEVSDAGPAISLVGSGTVVSGVGLVQAAWSGSAEADYGEGGDLDEIPLD